MYCNNIDKNGKKRISKKIVPGKCIFPFRYKNKVFNKCVDGHTGKWCPTKLTKTDSVDTWGYCIDNDVSKAANILTSMKFNTEKKNAANTLLSLKKTKKTKNLKINPNYQNKLTKKIKMDQILIENNNVYSIKKLDKSEMGEFGRMKYKGPFGGSISFYGLPLDILKSGIQKYIRRNETEKAIWCTIEYDLFRKIGKNTNGILTNMLNRIVITCVEDIGIGDINSIIYIDKELKYYYDNRHNFDDYRAKEALINIVSCLSISKKIRLCSHIKTVYMNSAFHSVIRDRYPKLYENINYINPIVENKYKLKNKKEEDDLRSIIDRIMTCFYNDNDQVFYHINAFLTKVRNEKGYQSRFRKKSGEYILWEIIFEYCKVGLGICGLTETKDYNKYLPYINVLFEWYKTKNNSRNENILYLINAYLIILRKIDIDKLTRYVNFSEINSNYKELIDEYYSRKNIINIDKFVVDMHTKLGRSLGMDRKEFGEEGSKVVNEEIMYLNKTYLDIYLLFKNNKLEDLKKQPIKTKKKLNIISKKLLFNGTNLNIKEELEHNILEKPLLVNIRPKYLENEKRYVHVGSRPSTYYAKFKLDGYKPTNILVKGPYKDNSISDQIEYSCMVDNLKPFLGLNKIGTRIISMKPTLKISYGVPEELRKFIIFNDFGTGIDTYKSKSFINPKKIDTKIKVYDKDNSNQLVKWVQKNNLSENEHILSKLLDILLFRQIIQTCDTNLTNLLIESDELLSIDENYREDFDLSIFFSHHQKKEVSDAILKFIIKNKETIINKLKNWIKSINSDSCVKMLEYYNIYATQKWNQKLNQNIEKMINIIKTESFSFK